MDRRTKIIKLVVILVISIISLTACSTKENKIFREETIQEEEYKEIPIDYPFHYGMEGYTLALVPSEACEGEYDIRLCNETGQTKQQFLLGKVTESLDFSYDDLTYDLYEDLEMMDVPLSMRTSRLF